MTVIDLVDQAGALDAADPLADFRDHFIGSDDPEIIAPQILILRDAISQRVLLFIFRDHDLAQRDLSFELLARHPPHHVGVHALKLIKERDVLVRRRAHENRTARCGQGCGDDDCI